MISYEIPAGAVVVGVDGSHHADQAVAWAALHAEAEGRDLVLLHAVQDSEIVGRAILDAVAIHVARTLPDGSIHTVMVSDDPRVALLEAAEHASMVVVGSHGRGPLKSLLLGSVSVAVASEATCPVVVVRPHHPGTVRRGVLVAADGTESSIPVLEFAFRQASERKLPLTVLHCVWDDLAAVGVARELQAPSRAYAESGLALAESMAGLAEKFPDVFVSKSIMRGAAETAVLELADKMNLVVLGHRPAGALGRAVFGSVARNVLEHAATIVAVVPQK